MLSGEDKKDVAKAFGKTVAKKVSTATNDSKSKALNKVKGDQPGQYRYVSPAAPSPHIGAEGRKEYYKKNKGAYIKNVLGKDKKYILPAKYHPKENSND